MTEANPPGADLHTAADRIGSILDPKPAEKPEPEATEPEAKEAEAPEVEAKEAPAQEPQDAQDQPQEAEQQETQAQSDFSTIQELADAIGIPVDDFLGKIKGKVKINGVEQDVTLADMRNGYQMESDYRRKTAELAEQRKAFEAEREQVSNELGQRYTEAQQITGILEQQLTAEYQAVDWNTLRVSDPAEYAAKKQEFGERYNYVQGLRANVNAQLQQQQQALQQKQVEGLQQMLLQESERLSAVAPEFGDEAKAKVIKGELKDFLRSQGYSNEEISNVYDHRQVLIIRDAMEYRKLKNKGVEVKNKVVNVPKLQKPGSNESRSDSNQSAIREKIARLKKTGRVEDAVALIKL